MAEDAGDDAAHAPPFAALLSNQHPGDAFQSAKELWTAATDAEANAHLFPDAWTFATRGLLALVGSGSVSVQMARTCGFSAMPSHPCFLAQDFSPNRGHQVHRRVAQDRKTVKNERARP